MVVVICALAALPAGWFAGVLVDRVPDRLPLFAPLPGVRLRGKYLVIHLLMVALFALAGARFHDSSVGQLVTVLVLFAALVPLSVIDIERFRLPDRIVLPTLVVALILVIGVSLLDDAPDQIRYALLGGAFYFGFLFIAHVIYPRGMGFGDVKLAAVMGLVVGWLGGDYAQSIGLVLWAMLIGFVTGSIVGMVLLAMRRRSTAIPFGPFLALGCAAAILASSALVPNL